MCILSSPKVVESADQIARKIVDTYLAPNKIFPELREMVNAATPEERAIALVAFARS
jgi:hypothetical protein